MFMAKYRFTGKNHFRNGERLEQGAVVEMDESEYEKFSFKFVPLEADDAPDNSSEDDESDVESTEAESDADEGSASLESESDESGRKDVSEILSQNLSPFRDDIESGEYDDMLDEIEIAEHSGQDRSGVYNALDERRDDISE